MHQWRFIKKSTHYGLGLPHRPAVVAALVSGLVSIVGFMVSARTNLSIHSQRLVFDENQAERKFDFDKELAERRFSYDSELAERKFAQEREQIVYKRRFELAEGLLADAYRRTKSLRK